MLFIADSESQLKPSFVFASKIAEQLGGGVAGNLVLGKMKPSRRQITGAKVQAPMTFHGTKHLLDKVIFDFGAVVVFLPGSQLLRFRTEVRRRVELRTLDSRPVLVTGYNGVVYESALAGLLWRVGYDVIAVNSKRDMEMFGGYLDELGADRSPLARTGLLLAQIGESKLTQAVERARSGKIENVMFACQAVSPPVLEERIYLLERMRDYALTHPDRGVYIKPRARPDERTFHVHDYHYETLYKEEYGDDKPDNLHFAYGNFRDVLLKTDLVITVSSTGLLEGLAAGVPGAILTDCGIKEDYGNHFFVGGSGLRTTMDDLIADRVPVPDMDWLEANGFGESDSLATPANRVAELVRQQNESNTLLPYQDVFYSPARAPYIHGRYLPKDKPAELSQEARLRKKLRKLILKPDLFFADALANRVNKIQKRISDRHDPEDLK